jgi:hypothetical protein
MSVTIMRFRAGSNAYAIAAGCVEAVGAARPAVPHLAWVLGGEVPDFGGGARTLHLAARGQRSEVTVDGPIELMDLESGDITPCRTTTSAMILGFARTTTGVVPLLDADRVVELLQQSSGGGLGGNAHRDLG